MNVSITSIKRFAVHDGDGIRTTVFFKGCPLKCKWCHNPETISSKPQIAFYRHKCVHCGKCVSICSCHTLLDGIHRFDSSHCNMCGKCVAACPKDALELFGKEMAVDEIYKLLIRDKMFYDESNGGITLSGGECLLYADFCAELLKKLKNNNINTAIDTCGFVSRSAIDKVLSYTDVFLYDIKAIDEDVHIKCTGQSNKMILENLAYIDTQNKRVEIRIPYVPGFNDSQIVKIGEFLSQLKNVIAVRILPYHNYAASKYTALAIENTLPERSPSEGEIQFAKGKLQTFGLICK